MDPELEDLSGDSVFFKNDPGEIFHTYSTYGRGGGVPMRLSGTYVNLCRYVFSRKTGKVENSSNIHARTYIFLILCAAAVHISLPVPSSQDFCLSGFRKRA